MSLFWFLFASYIAIGSTISPFVAAGDMDLATAIWWPISLLKFLIKSLWEVLSKW